MVNGKNCGGEWLPGKEGICLTNTIHHSPFTIHHNDTLNGLSMFNASGSECITYGGVRLNRNSLGTGPERSQEGWFTPCWLEARELGGGKPPFLTCTFMWLDWSFVS